MLKIYLSGVAILILAGCGQATNEAAPADNGAGAQANATIAPAEVNVAGNGQEQNLVWMLQAPIPDEFHGVYDRDGAACTSAGSEERLQVSAESLRFHESIGEVRNIRQMDDGTLLVEGDFQGEGEAWSNLLRLKLGAGGTLVVTQSDGSSLTRIRCP